MQAAEITQIILLPRQAALIASKKYIKNNLILYKKNGAPKMTRTSDTQFRKLLLYPTELWAHNTIMLIYDTMNQHKNKVKIANASQKITRCCIVHKDYTAPGLAADQLHTLTDYCILLPKFSFLQCPDGSFPAAIRCSLSDVLSDSHVPK